MSHSIQSFVETLFIVYILIEKHGKYLFGSSYRPDYCTIICRHCLRYSIHIE